MQIQKQPLEYPPSIEKAVAPALGNLNLVVKPFNKTTVLPALEIIGAVSLVFNQGFDKAIKTAQTTFLGRFDPPVEFGER